MEDEYVEQPLGFEDKHFPNHVYKLKKVLCSLYKLRKLGKKD